MVFHLGNPLPSILMGDFQFPRMSPVPTIAVCVCARARAHKYILRGERQMKIQTRSVTERQRNTKRDLIVSKETQYRVKRDPIASKDR